MQRPRAGLWIEYRAISPSARAHTSEAVSEYTPLGGFVLWISRASHLDESKLLNRCCDCDDRLAIPHRLDREPANLMGLSRKATNSKGGPQWPASRKVQALQRPCSSPMTCRLCELCLDSSLFKAKLFVRRNQVRLAASSRYLRFLPIAALRGGQAVPRQRIAARSDRDHFAARDGD